MLTRFQISHCMVVGFGITIAAFSTGLHYAGYYYLTVQDSRANTEDRISMGFLYLFMGVIVSSAVLPACLTLLWGGMNKQSAMWSPPVGLTLSLVSWIVTAQKLFGELTIDSLGANYPMLAGNVVALVSPCIIVPILTFVYGVGELSLITTNAPYWVTAAELTVSSDRYNWESMNDIRRGEDDDLIDSAHADPELIPGLAIQTASHSDAEQEKLLRNSKVAKWLTGIMTVALLILWPFPMFGSGYVFSKKFFTGWVVVGIVWVVSAFGCVGIYPVWEGRMSIGRVIKAITSDITGKRPPGVYHINGVSVDTVESDAQKPSGMATEKAEAMKSKRI
jgi:hypothetical protein